MSVGSVVIDTRIADGSTFVDLRLSHPMESGSRKDSQGTQIPPWFLTYIDVFLNDKPVALLELGPLISRNPAVSLVLNGGKADDIVKVVWRDNRGETGERSAQIAP